MTKNQIDYFLAKETEKHNRATEQETKRSNLASESISRDRNANEAEHYRRSDLANLEHYARMDAETARHQKASEDISRMGNIITQAHYERSDANAYTANLISTASLEETKRHQRVNEALTEYLNASQVALNEAKVHESSNQARVLAQQAELTRLQSNTEVMRAEDTKQAAMLKQSQRDLNVANMVAVPYNSAGSLLGGAGRFISSLTGLNIPGLKLNGHSNGNTLFNPAMPSNE